LSCYYALQAAANLLSYGVIKNGEILIETGFLGEYSFAFMQEMGSAELGFVR
jgi:hypothetical protein